MLKIEDPRFRGLFGTHGFQYTVEDRDFFIRELNYLARHNPEADTIAILATALWTTEKYCLSKKNWLMRWWKGIPTYQDCYDRVKGKAALDLHLLCR